MFIEHITTTRLQRAGSSFIRYLRSRHAVVTGTKLSIVSYRYNFIPCSTAIKIKKGKLLIYMYICVYTYTHSVTFQY